MKPLRYHPRARDELRAAVLLGESDHPGRGVALLAAVARLERRLCRFPESVPRWSQIDAPHPIRKAMVRRTPYLIVYLDLPAELVVVAVAHSRQAPGYWLERIDELGA